MRRSPSFDSRWRHAGSTRTTTRSRARSRHRGRRRGHRDLPLQGLSASKPSTARSSSCREDGFVQASALAETTRVRGCRHLAAEEEYVGGTGEHRRGAKDARVVRDDGRDVRTSVTSKGKRTTRVPRRDVGAGAREVASPRGTSVSHLSRGGTMTRKTSRSSQTPSRTARRTDRAGSRPNGDEATDVAAGSSCLDGREDGRAPRHRPPALPDGPVRDRLDALAHRRLRDEIVGRRLG